VQAFRCDTSKHPSHWYSLPDPGDPWYEVVDLCAKIDGSARLERVVVVVSHKDSPSWIDCPGANDNAAGTVCNMEVTRLLAGHSLRNSVRFLFCNEEHWPWTSVAAAAKAKERGDDLIAVLNLDGSGGTSPEEKAEGLHPSTAVYGTPEGEQLADLLAEVNAVYGIGLDQVKRFRKEPANDDGSFVKAGFPASIGVHGALDYENPFYHRPEDVPERLEASTLRRVAQLVAATILVLDEQ
jgi:Zn-dependent M28 family amino/carboxypeptidase